MFSKIRNKFLIPMVILVLLGMGVSSFLSWRTARNALETSRFEQLNQIIDITVHNIADWINNRKLDISNWANQDTVKTALKNNFLGKAARKTLNDDFARMQKEYHSYNSFHLAGPDGTIIVSSSPELIGKLNIKDREYFKKALQGKINMSKVLKSKTDGSPILIIAAPVVDNGGVAGVFYVLISMEDFNSKFIDWIKIGEKGYAFMVDNNDGTCLAHPDKNNIMNRHITEFDFGNNMLAANDGVFYYQSKNVDKVSVLRTFKEMGWKIVITTDVAESYAAANKLGKLNLILAISAVIIAATIIFLVANSIAKPINMVVEGLRDAAEGEGDLTKRLQVESRDEVGELASSFNTFVEKVQTIINNIQSNISTLNSSAGSLSGLSKNLSVNSQDSFHRSSTVASTM